MDLNGKRIFLYMNFFKDDYSIGITKKIHAQIKTLRQMGLDVIYTSYVEDGAVIVDNCEQIIYKKKFPVANARFKRYARRFLLLSTVVDYLKNTKVKLDFAYLRWHTFDKLFLKMLCQLNKCGAKCIVEAHAWTPNRVAESMIARYQIFNDNRYSKFAKDYVSLVAGMSEYDNIWGIKTVKIDNAIDLESISPRSWIKNESDIRVVSVSNERIYHGYDRLIKGLKNYYDNGGTRKIEVDFVGVNLVETKKLVHELGMDEQFHFHGKQFGRALDEIYDHSDLGIGALAHHRVGMFAGSSLKTKEYFAKGLPFIYGWKEPAFDETYPYALKIELCEDPLDMEQVIDFYDSIKDDDAMLTNMRTFAQEHYSWEKEFQKVFDAL